MRPVFGSQEWIDYNKALDRLKRAQAEYAKHHTKGRSDDVRIAQASVDRLYKLLDNKDKQAAGAPKMA